MKKIILTSGLAVLLIAATQNLNAQTWSITGNAGTNPTNNFIGTTDAKNFKIRTNNVVRMTFTSNGKIGIGNAAPVSKVDILGTATATDPVVNIVGKYVGDADVIGLNASSVPTDTNGIGVVGNGNLVGVNGFGNNIGVEGDGNIGVLGFSAYATGAAADPTGVWGQTSGGSLGNAVFGISEFATQNVSIWGIATDSSTAGANVDFAGYFQGNMLAWRYYTPSDQRLKKDIQPLGNVLSKLNKIETATYNFRSADYPKLYLPTDRQTGFMAANLQEQFPTLVQDVTLPEKVDPKTGRILSQAASIKVVNYMGMIPVLTAAIQEQQTLISTKDAEIAALRTQISTIENRLNAIEAAIANTSNAERVNSNLDGAALQQNNPNPFSQSTTIRYTLPEYAKNARLVITSSNGVVVSTYALKGKGNGQVVLNANEFAAGNYSYSLIIDGAAIDTKSLVLTK